MKTCLLTFFFLFSLGYAFGQPLTLNPPGPYIDACGYWPTATVTANPSGALSYDWYRNDCGQIWFAISGQTVDLSTGHWYCVATWPGGYTSTSATIAVRIPSSVSCAILHCDLPSSCSTGCALELSGPLCPNEWSTYQWTLNNVPVAGATNWFYNAIASGSYHCIFGNSACSVTSLDSAVVQFPCDPPTNGFAANITSTSAKLKWTIDDCGIGYRVQYRPLGTFSWTTKNQSINTGKKKITGLTANTTYQWRVKTKCSSDPVQYSSYTPIQTFITLLRQANAEEKQFKVSFSPNPFTQSAVITINGKGEFDFILYDVFGREVKRSTIGSLKSEIQRGTLPAGIYVYHLKQNEKMMGQGKVVIE